VSPEEEAQMLLAHTLSEAEMVYDQIPEVVAAMRYAQGRLNGRRSNTDVLCCYVDTDLLEQQLHLAIVELGLRKGLELPITEGELHTMVIQALQRYVERRLMNLYEYLRDTDELWVREVLRPLMGWEPSQ